MHREGEVYVYRHAICLLPRRPRKASTAPRKRRPNGMATHSAYGMMRKKAAGARWRGLPDVVV